jgi:FkbM family methyltransferase
MTKHLKPLVGRTLLQTCELCPWTKPLLQKWGLRTSQEWFTDKTISVQLPGGKRMKMAGVAENYLTFELFWRGLDYYEPISLALMQELASGVNTFIDIGANIGFYSLVLASTNPHLRVTSFEPNPKAFRILSANMRLNDLDRVKCEPMAVSDNDGKAVLFMCPSDMSASLEADFESSTAGDPVTITTLDSYLTKHPIPDKFLLKVDVEGHESALFRGAAKTLENRKPDILCEITGPLAEDVTAFLGKKGYHFYSVTDEGLIRHDELELVSRGEYLFLNYLFTTARESEVKALFERIRPRIQNLDLSRTSKHVSPDMITRLRSRQDHTSAGMAA